MPVCDMQVTKDRVMRTAYLMKIVRQRDALRVLGSERGETPCGRTESSCVSSRKASITSRPLSPVNLISLLEDPEWAL